MPSVGVTGVLVRVGVTGVLVRVGVTGVLVKVGVTGVLVRLGVTGVLVKVGGRGVLVTGRGVLLGFIGDIWLPTSVRRIFWLQRHATKFTLKGAPVALLVRDQPHTLYGFRMSNPLPVPFPLLADTDGEVHRLFNMERNPGLVLLDRNLKIQAKWLMPDERVWPVMSELIKAVEAMPR